jgi:hypothetical protein
LQLWLLPFLEWSTKALQFWPVCMLSWVGLCLRGSGASKTTFSCFLHSSALGSSCLWYLWNLGLWWHAPWILEQELINLLGSIGRVWQFLSFLCCSERSSIFQIYDDWNWVALPEDLAVNEIVLYSWCGATAPMGQMLAKWLA